MASIEMDRASVATAVSLQKRPSSLSLAFRVVRFLATKAAGATSLKSSAVGHPRSRFESEGGFESMVASTADDHATAMKESLDVWVRRGVHGDATRTTEAATAAVAPSPAATEEEDESPSPVPVRPSPLSGVFTLSSRVDNEQPRTAQSDEAEASDDIWIVEDPPIAWQMTI